MRRDTHVERSPLYTSKHQAAEKKKFIAANGRDVDGAYRVHRKFDAELENHSASEFKSFEHEAADFILAARRNRRSA